MLAVGDSFRNARVAAVFLIHGTFLGDDALGLLTTLAGLAPGLGGTLRGLTKQTLDSIAGDVGNFTRDYAHTWQSAMNRPGERLIPVHLFHWSSENHHVGRANGAVQLLLEMVRCKLTEGNRVLLVGHSHGGNVLALLTNLIGGDCETRRLFFEAARSFYYLRLLRHADFPDWEKLYQLACQQDGALLPGTQCDVATMGTPVRYGWETIGYDHLLHFIHHRPCPGLPEYQAVFPQKPQDIWQAKYGDFIQQVGIAGTNLSPPLWAWRTFRADVRLGRLFQTHGSAADLLARLRLGVRTHADGENLLIDYGPSEGTPAQHVFGHAVYTRMEWLLFHAEQIAQRMYGLVRG